LGELGSIRRRCFLCECSEILSKERGYSYPAVDHRVRRIFDSWSLKITSIIYRFIPIIFYPLTLLPSYPLIFNNRARFYRFNRIFASYSSLNPSIHLALFSQKRIIRPSRHQPLTVPSRTSLRALPHRTYPLWIRKGFSPPWYQ
jgi:hypothetical protein